MAEMPWYRVEIVRIYPGSNRRDTLASHELPESVMAGAALNALTVDGILAELKRRLKDEG